MKKTTEKIEKKTPPFRPKKPKLKSKKNETFYTLKNGQKITLENYEFLQFPTQLELF
jgi:hypothetical protein